MNAATIITLFAALATTFETHKEQLGELDAALGDGDHGVSMARGFEKAKEALEAGESHSPDVGERFGTAGRAFMSGVGGASGPLFAMIFLELGKASAGEHELTADALKSGLEGAATAIKRLGKAELGDKTMLDVLIPVNEALQKTTGLGAALALAAQVSEVSARQTTQLAAKRGRAQHVAGAGAGHADPGATSLAHIFQTCNQVYLEGSHA